MSLLVVCGSCVPYAVPPATVDVGGQRLSANGARTQIHADVGFAPLQLVRGTMDRAWDATLSGSFDRSESRNRFGLAAAGGLVLHPWGLFEDEVANRLLVQAVARWTTDGEAIGARIGLEHSVFTHGEVTSSNAGGVTHGEGGIGLYLEADRWTIDGASWGITAGVTFRVPAMAGIACCAR